MSNKPITDQLKDTLQEAKDMSLDEYEELARESLENERSSDDRHFGDYDLPRIVREFCEGQKWAVQTWKDQPHIKPLFDFAKNYSNKQQNK